MILRACVAYTSLAKEAAMRANIGGPPERKKNVSTTTAIVLAILPFITLTTSLALIEATGLAAVATDVARCAPAAVSPRLAAWVVSDSNRRMAGGTGGVLGPPRC